MARTINLTQISSKGRGDRRYTSIYFSVQGKAELGDTILLRDGAFIVTRVGDTYANKLGRAETHLDLKTAE